MLLKGIAGKKIPLFLPCSTTTTAANKTGTWRFFQPVYLEKTAPCAAACPSGEDIPRIEMLLSRNALKDAWQIIMVENPFPGICGRVCFHPCEQVCNRGQLDEPIAIRQLERRLGDSAINENWALASDRPKPKTKTAAIIGAGPAGLAAAYFLTRLGYGCEVFEAQSEPGGLLRWGIPAYRLPAEILTAEIDRIRALGITINCNTHLEASQMQELQSRYDALIITSGYGRSIGLPIGGGEHAVDGLALLNEIRHQIPSKQEGQVAIIGGGNTAVDVARSLIRLGASPTIVYRRRREDMPAFEPEIVRALEEGVRLRELEAPIDIRSEKQNGRRMYSLTVQKMTPSKDAIGGRTRVIPIENQTDVLEVDRVVTAIGADVADNWIAAVKKAGHQIKMSHCHLLDVQNPVILAGDITTPVKSVSDAIASGKQVALALDILNEQGFEKIAGEMAACQVGSGPAVSMSAYLQRRNTAQADRTDASRSKAQDLVEFDQINIEYFQPADRVYEPYLELVDRTASFTECEPGLAPDAVKSEAERCFNCGTCSACDNCRLFCPEAAVLVNKAVRRIDLDYCKGCGVCVTECPRNAMAMEE